MNDVVYLITYKVKLFLKLQQTELIVKNGNIIDKYDNWINPFI